MQRLIKDHEGKTQEVVKEVLDLKKDVANVRPEPEETNERLSTGQRTMKKANAELHAKQPEWQDRGHSLLKLARRKDRAIEQANVAARRATIGLLNLKRYGFIVVGRIIRFELLFDNAKGSKDWNEGFELGTNSRNRITLTSTTAHPPVSNSSYTLDCTFCRVNSRSDFDIVVKEFVTLVFCSINTTIIVDGCILGKESPAENGLNHVASKVAETMLQHKGTTVLTSFVKFEPGTKEVALGPSQSLLRSYDIKECGESTWTYYQIKTVKAARAALCNLGLPRRPGERDSDAELPR
jgi:hypothetical protein